MGSTAKTQGCYRNEEFNSVGVNRDASLDSLEELLNLTDPKEFQLSNLFDNFEICDYSKEVSRLDSLSKAALPNLLLQNCQNYYEYKKYNSLSDAQSVSKESEVDNLSDFLDSLNLDTINVAQKFNIDNKENIGDVSLSDLYFNTDGKLTMEPLNGTSGTDGNHKHLDFSEQLSYASVDASDQKLLKTDITEKDLGIVNFLSDLVFKPSIEPNQDVETMLTDVTRIENSSGVTYGCEHGKKGEQTVNFSVADLYFAPKDEAESARGKISETNLQEEAHFSPLKSMCKEMSDPCEDADSGFAEEEEETLFSADIDLSSARKEMQSGVFCHQPPPVAEYAFERTPFVKKKPSLFCKVLCSRPKPYDLSNVPKHPANLHELLEKMDYWKYFSFDSPSPDDIVKQKQSRAFRES